MPFSSINNDVKGNVLDVQLHVAQCAALAYTLLFSAEPKPGGTSFNKEFDDTKPEHFLAGGSSLFAPIFTISKRGILVAENHMWFEDAEIGFFIIKGIERSKTWYRSEGNTILGSLIMLTPLTLGVAHNYANEGMRTSTPLNLDNVVSVTEQFLKNSTTDDCIHLTEALNTYISTRILPSDKKEDDFNSYLEIYRNERTNLYEYTKFYEGRDLVFYELSHRYQITLNYGISTFKRVYEENNNFKNSIIQTYVTLLSEKKDTHIAKRFGNEIATDVTNRAKKIIKSGGIFTDDGKMAIEELDNYLRNSQERPINPGSIADITLTTIFLALLQGYRP